MNGDVMSILSSIMQDPAAMEKAMSMASMLSSSGILDGALNNSEKPKEAPKEAQNKEGVADESGLKDLLSSMSSSKDSGSSGKSKGAISMGERLALLLAIKPYLSEDKASKLESVIRILKIVSALEKSGIKLF